jgi:hypothetical protein
MTPAETNAALELQAPIEKEIAAHGATVQPTIKPPKGFARPLADILSDLSKPIAPQHLRYLDKRNKKSGAVTKIPYIPWYLAVKYLDYYAPNWCSEIRSLTWSEGRLTLTVRLLIPCAEGWVYREATGTEEEPDDDQQMYGDPSSNAESMALRRAAAKFGLGLYLYNKK